MYERSEKDIWAPPKARARGAHFASGSCSQKGQLHIVSECIVCWNRSIKDPLCRFVHVKKFAMTKAVNSRSRRIVWLKRVVPSN